jgi:hypothetical protein
MARILAAIVTTIGGMVLLAGIASAYPPVVGNLTSTGSSTSVTPGGTIDITCTLRDPGGAPIDNEFLVFAITDNPGNAQLQKTSGVTSADGQVSVPLRVAASTGQVEVTCSAPGSDLESTFVAQVLNESEVLGVSTIQPPSTGDGGLIGNSAPSWLLAIGLLPLAGAFGWLRLQSASRP